MAEKPPPPKADRVATGVHLCPILLFYSAEKNFTPFNLVPLSAAMNAERLLILACAPFHTFRFFGDEFTADGTTYPLDIWFLTPDEPLDKGPRIGGRPVVVWCDQGCLLELLPKIDSHIPACILVITDEPELPPDIAAYILSKERMATVSVNAGAERRFHPESPIRIWTAFLRLVDKLVNLADGTKKLGPGNRMAPELKTPVTLQRRILAAERGASSPWTEKLKSTSVPWDFVVAPSAIILNHMTFTVSVWSEEVLKPDTAHEVSLAFARRLLAARGLSNILMYAEKAEEDKNYERMVQYAFKRIPTAFRPLLKQAIQGGFSEDEIIAIYSELYAKVPDELSKAAPHQIVLLCPSATLAMERVKANFGRRGVIMVDHGLREKDPKYFAEIEKIAGGPGRLAVFPEPENEIQKEIVSSIMRGVRLEAQFLSAIAVVYSTRFGCPALKLTRTGSEVFDPFLAVHDEFLKADSDYTRVADAIGELSKHTAVLFPDGYLDFVLSERDGMLHSFGDYPLEFAGAGHDYLGYRMQLSRTPITPGYIALTNYNVTEHSIYLPTRVEECIIVTPFPEDDEVTEAVKAILAQSGTAVATVIINDKNALKERLRDPEIRCLIYIGHGYHNVQLDENALIMPGGVLFGEGDLEDIGRVPPLIVLVGCTTAPSVSVFSGMHQAFLRYGASVVVGTSFQVPKLVGIQFLTTFVEYLTGARKLIPRDVAELVTMVRHDIRVNSVLLSLVELGRISWVQMDEILAEHKARLKMLPAPPLHRAAILDFAVLAKILTLRKLIPHVSTAPMQWGIIPYPLFFSTFGYPWTMRNKRWEQAGGSNSGV